MSLVQCLVGYFFPDTVYITIVLLTDWFLDALQVKYSGWFIVMSPICIEVPGLSLPSPCPQLTWSSGKEQICSHDSMLYSRWISHNLLLNFKLL